MLVGTTIPVIFTAIIAATIIWKKQSNMLKDIADGEDNITFYNRNNTTGIFHAVTLIHPSI